MVSCLAALLPCMACMVCSAAMSWCLAALVRAAAHIHVGMLARRCARLSVLQYISSTTRRISRRWRYNRLSVSRSPASLISRTRAADGVSAICASWHLCFFVHLSSCGQCRRLRVYIVRHRCSVGAAAMASYCVHIRIWTPCCRHNRTRSWSRHAGEYAARHSAAVFRRNSPRYVFFFIFAVLSNAAISRGGDHIFYQLFGLLARSLVSRRLLSE